jgi:hypothetical protein
MIRTSTSLYFISRPPIVSEFNMSLRMMLIAVACILWSATVQAAPSDGSSPSGSNFACNGVTCQCDGSYDDCGSMKNFCRSKISCPSRTKCGCLMKLPPARSRTAPKPGTPVMVPPTVKQQ